MSRPFDSSEAESLLKDINETSDFSQSISIGKYRSSYGSLCNKTKTLVSSGDFFGGIQDITPIVTALQDCSFYLDSAIKRFKYIDEGSVAQANVAGAGMDAIMDKFYLEEYGDMYVRIDGKPYILFSQTGHGFDDEGIDSPLLTDFFLFTDGNPGSSGRGTSLYGASCSFCSTLNCITALKGYDYVMELTGANNYFDEYFEKCGSKNAASLAAVNRAFTEDWLNACNPNVNYNDLSDNAKIMRDKYVTGSDYSASKVSKWRDMLDNKTALGTSIPNNMKFTNNDNKPRGIDTFVDSYFGGDIKSLTGDYDSGYSVDRANKTISNYLSGLGYSGDSSFEDLVDNGAVKMVIRMPKNTSNSARYKSGSGHYIASVGINKDGSLDYVILDSAVDIDNRNDSVTSKNNRIGYVPKDFFSGSKNGPRGVIYVLDEEKISEYMNS